MVRSCRKSVGSPRLPQSEADVVSEYPRENSPSQLKVVRADGTVEFESPY
ncbi:hypothetical protein [Streptomonospora sp. PA3]|nr:hypothetical protein [Streptomonospora sp. PA3]